MRTNSCKKRLDFVANILLVLLTVKESLGINQVITFYKSEKCTGDNYTLSESIANLANRFKDASSFLVESGAWRVQESLLTLTTLNDTKKPATKDDKENERIWNIKVCRSVSLATHKFVQVDRIGFGNLETDSITLFPNADHTGEAQLFNSSVENTTNTGFKSWAITGKKNWGLYAEKDFMGTLECLQASRESEGHNVALGSNKTAITVKSIRVCGNGYKIRASFTTTVFIIICVTLFFKSLISV